MPTPEREPRLRPRDIVRSGLCIGCGSCVAQAGPGPRMALDRHGELKPHGPTIWLGTPTRAFSRTCPFSPSALDETQLAEGLFPQAPHADALIGRFEAAYVGHVAEPGFRERGSSGGMVSWMAAELLRQGLVDGVAHVVADADPQREPRHFRYRISRTPQEASAGAKSRYYPVEMSQVLAEMRSTPGRYALVGVPCFIKAAQLLRREDALLRERLVFTLGLVCGHMKSTRLLESFAWQMGVAPEEIEAMDWRLKNHARPANWYTAQFQLRDGRTVQRDWFHLAEGDWGAGFFQNPACNACDDVVGETADICFGDAWVEPYAADGRGTNVVVVRSPRLMAVIARGIDSGRLQLETVDAQLVRNTQAAGFRQRREGLAYRLTWHRRGIRPRKRVAPDRTSLCWRRKLIYRMRAFITASSRQLFPWACRTGLQSWYLRWARAAVALYHALAYSEGRLGALLQRWEARGRTL